MKSKPLTRPQKLVALAVAGLLVLGAGIITVPDQPLCGIALLITGFAMMLGSALAAVPDKWKRRRQTLAPAGMQPQVIVVHQARRSGCASFLTFGFSACLLSIGLICCFLFAPLGIALVMAGALGMILALFM